MNRTRNIWNSLKRKIGRRSTQDWMRKEMVISSPLPPDQIDRESAIELSYRTLCHPKKKKKRSFRRPRSASDAQIFEFYVSRRPSPVDRPIDPPRPAADQVDKSDEYVSMSTISRELIAARSETSDIAVRPILKTSHRDQKVFETYDVPRDEAYDIPRGRDEAYDIPRGRDEAYDIPHGRDQIYDPSRDEIYDIPRGRDEVYDIPRDKGEVYDIPRGKDQIYGVPRGKGEVYDIPRGKDQIYGIPRGKDQIYGVPRGGKSKLPKEDPAPPLVPPKTGSKSVERKLGSSVKRTVSFKKTVVYDLPRAEEETYCIPSGRHEGGESPAVRVYRAANKDIGFYDTLPRQKKAGKPPRRKTTVVAAQDLDFSDPRENGPVSRIIPLKSGNLKITAEFEPGRIQRGNENIVF